MTILTVFIILAMLFTIATLIVGVASMAHGGKFDQRYATQLMGLRVGLQGLVLLLLLVAFYFSAK